MPPFMRTPHIVLRSMFASVALSAAAADKPPVAPSPPTVNAATGKAPLSSNASVSAVKVFVPGFVVRELPIALSNQNNVEYAPDGRLFAAGYDGRVHLLRDTDGDGLEDKIATLWDKTSGDFPLGIVFHEGALFISYRSEIVRFRDLDGDGVPETRDIFISNWDKTSISKAPLILTARMDFANGLAIGPDGAFYVAMGSAAFTNPYRRDASGHAHYKPSDLRGCLLRISPDGSTVVQVATGLRYVVSIQFNRLGDLFLTDQEGATWVPNGNPLDELLHVQAGRHYGFPSRHPRYLPDVIDEPSVFDYAPQHQSICGFRFNESRPGRARFGPPEWEGDALLTGESRGKLYRTQLVKTAAGYVAQSHLFAAIQGLPVDCTLSPTGELLVATHTGMPDWGTGPKGIGRIFKLKYVGGAEPRPLFASPVSPTETRVEFDGPLPRPYEEGLAAKIAIRSGRYVDAGDRYEINLPVYAVVKAQRTERVGRATPSEVALSSDNRALTIQGTPRTNALTYGLSLPDIRSVRAPVGTAHTIAQDPGIELSHDLSGCAVQWTSEKSKGGKDSSSEGWNGWLPHPDLEVSRAFTRGSANHAGLFQRLAQPGTLRLQGQLDLAYMLRPEIQPGATLDFDYAPETVTVVYTSSCALTVAAPKGANVTRIEPRSVRIVVQNPQHGAWIPFDLSLQTVEGDTPQLTVEWFTAEDPRPRALPLRRVLMPWARPAPPVVETRTIPEIAGGHWEKGKALYFGQAACSACHTIRGEGAKFGPDLTNSIHRDYDALLKDIVQPSASINPDRLGYRVELDDGSVASGIVTDDTATRLTLLAAGGDTRSIEKSQIRATQPMEKSLMPEGLVESLAPDQLRDLMTFLLSDRKDALP